MIFCALRETGSNDTVPFLLWRIGVFLSYCLPFTYVFARSAVGKIAGKGYRPIFCGCFLLYLFIIIFNDQLLAQVSSESVYRRTDESQHRFMPPTVGRGHNN